MSQAELIAILPGEGADDPLGPEAASGGLLRSAAGLRAVYRVVPQGRSLAALFAADRGGDADRRAQAEALVTRQRLLEFLHQQGDVLPVLPGADAPLDQAEAMLIANADLLRDGLERLRGRAQRQVLIGWDEEDASRRFADHPAMPDGLAAVADALAEDAAARLAGAAEATLDLPRDGPAMLLNQVLLGARRDPPELDAALAAIDRIWTEGLSIRVRGPSPAISFCAARLRRPDKAEIRAAARILGLNDVRPGLLPPLDRVEDAFRARARAAATILARGAHGGGSAAPGLDLGALQAARNLLARLAQAQGALRAAGRPASGPLILANLHRDGAAADRAPVRARSRIAAA